MELYLPVNCADLQCSRNNLLNYYDKCQFSGEFQSAHELQMLMLFASQKYEYTSFWVYCEKDADDEAARKEETWKA